MNSVLIDAVLSGSPDCGLLLEALSWQSDSCPETERVEALTVFIDCLRPFLNDPDTVRLSAASKKSVREKIESLLWTKCLPLFWKISPGASCRERTAAACRLMSACLPLCEESVPGKVALSLLPSLQLSEEELLTNERLGVETASEVMAAVLPFLPADEQLSVLTAALSCVKTLPDALVSKITVRLILTVLNCNSGVRLKSILTLILEDLCSWHSISRSAVVTERSLLCLTALSDHLLQPHSLTSSSSCDPDPPLSLPFWRILQDGLTHRDSVSRKRALYLLKMCVTLSEKQGTDCPLSPSGDGKTSH